MPQRSPDPGTRDDPYADEPAPLTPKQIATLLDVSRRAIMLELVAVSPHGDFRPSSGTCATSRSCWSGRWGPPPSPVRAGTRRWAT